MANRTLKFIGQSYGTSAPLLTVTFDGNTVFSGPALSVANDTPPSFPDFTGVTVYEAEIPLNLSGPSVFNCVLTVTGGTGLYTSGVLADYTGTGDPANPSGPGNFQYLPDVNSNVAINGVTVSVPDPRPPSLPGAWWYWVPAGSTFTSTVTIPQGYQA